MIARRYHRWIAVFAVFFALYIAPTGIATQSMDLWALLHHAPASNPTMKSIRAGLYGPPNFQVITNADFAGPALPQGFSFVPALAKLEKVGEQVAPNGGLSFVELRNGGAGPIGVVGSGASKWTIDPNSSAIVSGPTSMKPGPISSPSVRGRLKDFHRMKALGSWFVVLDAIAGLTIIAMILFGLRLYWTLYKARLKSKRRGLFWKAGGWWRVLHRSTALVASLFLLVIAGSGTILSISSTGVVIYTAMHGGKRDVIDRDLSAPLASDDLQRMLTTTLGAFHRDHPTAPIKALRLRYFAGMPQGVVVADPGGGTDQLVYNAHTGREVSLTEPQYPPPGQTFGWQVDETAKMIHRGDYFGLTGRWMSLLSGLALLYVAISGAWLYGDLWRRRAKAGRRAIFWR